MIGNGVTGWDMGCRTLEFYVNSLAKEGEWPTRKGKADGQTGKVKAPRGFLGACGGDLVDQLPARALRMSNKVKRRHKARYPITRRRGFMGSKEDMNHRTIGNPTGHESPLPRVL
jgi:hypothetical protein